MRHVGNMQAGPWSARGARASRPSIESKRIRRRASRGALLDYTQWEFTVAVGRAIEAGGPDESRVLGYVGNPRPGRVAGPPCVTLGVMARRIRRRARGGAGRRASLRGYKQVNEHGFEFRAQGDVGRTSQACRYT